MAPPPAVPPVASAPSAPAAKEDPATIRANSDRLLASGDLAGGLVALRRATELDPSAKNHGDLGQLLEKMTDFDEALMHLRAAADLDPNNADRWIALANGYYHKVQLGEAWKAERKAKEVEPGLVLGRDASGMRVRQSPAPATR